MITWKYRRQVERRTVERAAKDRLYAGETEREPLDLVGKRGGALSQSV